MSDEEILMKRCPFCGSGTKLIFHGMHKVECSKRKTGCPVNMRTHYHDTAEGAIADWNTRDETIFQIAKELYAALDTLEKIQDGTYSNPDLLPSSILISDNAKLAYLQFMGEA